MEKYYVYILKSDSIKNPYYIGQTNNLEERVNRHKNNRNEYTKNKGNWELVISVELATRLEAIQLEHRLKKMKNSRKAIEYLEKMV